MADSLFNFGFRYLKHVRNQLRKICHQNSCQFKNIFTFVI